MYVTKASLVAQILPVTPVWSLDFWEDLLEESMEFYGQRSMVGYNT